MSDLLKAFDAPENPNIPALHTGDSVSVHAYCELTDLATQQGRRFLFESAVMDGAPIFSLFREPLPATEVRAFSGVLNSTTNMTLNLPAEQRLEGTAAVCAVGIARGADILRVHDVETIVRTACMINCGVLMRMVASRISRNIPAFASAFPKLIRLLKIP